MNCPHARSTSMPKGRHGSKSEVYYIEKDQYSKRGKYGDYTKSNSYRLGFNEEDPGAQTACAAIPPSFRFCRLFPTLNPFRPDDQKLIDLATAMAGNPTLPLDSDIPAGYTYLGQFIDHDITRDETEGLPEEDLDPETIIQGRSPSLDLDSLYGGGPSQSPQLYIGGAMGKKFLIGMTTPSQGTSQTNLSFPNDLPRDSSKAAIIGDNRNDENLAVAQTHLAFLKFHNAVIDKEGVDFNTARKIVTQHYQSIVLFDFLTQFVDSSIVSNVISKPISELFFPVECGTIPCMPVEFSVAAYRMGHTLIRNEYEWNAVFNSTPQATAPGSLSLLFSFTGSGGMFGSPTLPSNWIIDWRRFYDFGSNSHPDPNANNVTRKLDPFLSPTLTNLPEFAGMEAKFRSLISRNLLRGSRIGLPTGQDVANAMGIAPLSQSDLSSGADGQVAADNGFDSETPLWYYILKEAEVQQSGNQLGELGSNLITEVFVGLARGTPDSILCQPNTWKPKTSLGPDSSDRYTMVDLLNFVGDLNPIGDL